MENDFFYNESSTHIFILLPIGKLFFIKISVLFFFHSFFLDPDKGLECCGFSEPFWIIVHTDDFRNNDVWCLFVTAG